MSPVALRVNVAEVERLDLAGLDLGDGARNLARDKCPAAARRLVVEEDAVARVHAVRLAVVLDDPEGVKLGDAVGRARVEGRRLRLRDLNNLTIKLRRRGLEEQGRLSSCDWQTRAPERQAAHLVEADVVLEAGRADGVEDPKRAETVNVTSVLGHLERDLDVRLGTKVVNLGRLPGKEGREAEWLAHRLVGCKMNFSARRTHENLRNDVDEVGRVATRRGT